jgi:O-methyltransferase involved in polyketide biosynthesis
MNKIDTVFTGIRNSAFVTLYGRWRDSLDGPRAILGDPWAATLAERLSFDFSQLSGTNYARYTIAARTRVLDDWVGRFLSDHPGAAVLDVGCGLDSRVFRIDPAPGHHWYDTDFPDLIELRDRLYPDRPGHTSIGADVADPDWLERIPNDRPVIVVADSVCMFLSEEEVRQLLRRVVDHFPGGEVVFTAYSSVAKRWESKKGLAPFFERNDITMRWTYDGPGDVARLDDRLRLVERRSQTELGLYRKAALYYRALCAIINLVPRYRYSATILRYRF